MKSIDLKDISKPATVIVIPALNEVEHIEATINALRTKDANGADIPIWVMDGGSSDGTAEHVRGLGLPFVEVLKNEKRTQANAINLAASRARRNGGFKVLIRADAHAEYPEGFVSGLLSALEESGADSVVVPMSTVGGNEIQDAASVLYNSWLGNGGSPHRKGGYRGFVDHGHHAAFRLAPFMELGGYDPQFRANEDAEFDKRLTAAGYRIFLESRCTIGYIPRDTYLGYWKQMFRNGRFRMMTTAKHRQVPGLRQLLPIGVGPALAGSLTLGALVHPIFLAVTAVYLGLVLALAMKETLNKDNMGVFGMFRVAALAVISHTAFSFGAMRSLLSKPFWNFLTKPVEARLVEKSV